MAMSPRLLRPVASGFNPKRLAGLGGWWDATDSSTYTLDTGVTEWRDKSGLGQKWSQAVGANQPAINSTGIGGKPALSFDGSNDWMDLGSQAIGGNNLLADAGNPFAIYMVTKSVATTVARTLFAKASGTVASRTLQFFVSNPSTGAFTVVTRGTQTASSAGFLPASTDGMFVYQWSGSAGTFRFNSATEVDGVGAASVEAENVTLGCRTASSPGGGFWEGLIGEVLFYNRILSAAEQSALFRYLNAKWGLSLT